MHVVAAVLALAVLVGAPLPAAAQAASVSGSLFDSSTGRPVAGAVLELLGTGVRRATGEDGRFLFAAVPPGGYRITVTHVAYGTHEDSVYVGTSDVAITIRISPRAIALEALRVEAAARDSTRSSQAYVISRAEIERTLGRARNIGDVVRTYIPGASMYETRAGYICLEFRGARGARTRGCNFPLVVVDDVPIPAPAQFLRDTPPEDIERIEFVPASVGAARYGLDSQYGALVIATRRSGAGSGVRPVPTAPRYPGYAWEREQAGHPWKRTMAASSAGNALGVAMGLAVLGCFGADDQSGDCLTRRSFGTGMLALTLPLAGTAASANLFGATAGSHGRALPTVIASAAPLLLGYAMLRDGETADNGTSRLLGGAFVFIGAPLVATIADGLFRRAREPEPQR